MKAMKAAKAAAPKKAMKALKTSSPTKPGEFYTPPKDPKGALKDPSRTQKKTKRILKERHRSHEGP